MIHGFFVRKTHEKKTLLRGCTFHVLHYCTLKRRVRAVNFQLAVRAFHDNSQI